MWLLSIFSGALFALPIAVTVGGYIGFDQRILKSSSWSGQAGSTGGSDTSSGGGSGVTGNDTSGTYCQKSIAITPSPGRYVFNPNQWGDDNDQGDLCMNITAHDDAPSGYAAGFSATWTYPVGPAAQPVHAFPNANLALPHVLPVLLSNLSALTLDVTWSYSMGNENSTTTNVSAVEEANVNTNVCVDMFLSTDKSNATNTTQAAYEVMVWLGRFGDATDPIGYAEGSQDNYTVNGTTFDLYYGDNSLGQRAFSWVAQENTTEFAGDIAPLVQRLANESGPDASNYLGYVAFGSEALYSTNNVTFYVPKLEINVVADS